MIEFTASPITLDAAAGDSEAPRTITGIALPWSPVSATVSSGEKVSFLRGAFDLEAKNPKLLENHDPTQLRGVVTELADSDEGLLFTAKFAKTRAADDAIELIKAGAYDSVSIGAIPLKFTMTNDGTMLVSSAIASEISLVSSPAFKDAVITEIAASEPDPEVVEEAIENPTQDTSEEEPMSQETQVEASAPDAIPTTPLFAQARKDVKLPTPVEYLSAAIKGGAHWAEMRNILKFAAPDVTTTEIPGVVPTPVVGSIYNNFQGKRPAIDALGARSMSAIPGSSFVRPVVTTNVSQGLQSPQNSTLTAGTFGISELTFNKGSFGGYVELSEQAMDWSAPEVLGALLDDMSRIYANGTDALACDAITDGVTQTLAFGTLTDPADWAAWIGDAAADILVNSNGNHPSHLMIGTSIWASLMKLVDSTGRPLFPNVSPMNAYGSLDVTSDMGMAFGCRVVVDRNFADDTLILCDPSGAEYYEQVKGSLQLDSPSTMSKVISFRGYAAAKVIDATKFVQATYA